MLRDLDRSTEHPLSEAQSDKMEHWVLPNLEFKGTRRFSIRRRVGEGGMGVVYEAYDHDRETVVALKTLRNVDAQSVYRFKNEFRQLAEIEHPNLVRLGELHCEDGLWFFTMEFVEGESFLHWV